MPGQDLPAEGDDGTFCILPWTRLQVAGDGSITPCCVYNPSFKEPDGRSLTVFGHTLGDVWNSEQLRLLRRDLVEGKAVSGCADCYYKETLGAHSLRQVENQKWEGGELNEGGLTIAQLRAGAAAADYRAGAAPASLQLEVGNQCNLKCRMCCGYNSSRIARDETHNRWAKEWSPGDVSANWVRDPTIVRDHLLQHPGQLRHLYFYGGETLLMREVGDLLGYLVDAGVAPNISVIILTNGTSAKAPWLKLTEQFKHLELAISLDGYGTLNEYIRYPSRWQTIVDNIDAFKELPRVYLSSGVTLQAYNVLGLVDLFRFLDTAGLYFFSNPLLTPAYLGVGVLPLRVRRLAAERLRAYAAADCRPFNKEHVLALAAWIEGLGDGHDERLLRQFMLFTNDLDATRGQSLRATCPELVGLIEETGFRWTDETLHAGRRPLALAE